jgi:hypothetical protein
MKKLPALLSSLIILSLTSCDFFDDSSGSTSDKRPIEALHFIDEAILEDGLLFNETIVGGLSGIDYVANNWVLISDTSTDARYYNATINFDLQGFNDITITDVTFLLNSENQPFPSSTVDPEAIRLDRASGGLIWTSEGNITNGVNPFIRKSTFEGQFISDIQIPTRYTIDSDETTGPRQNGVFEGITRDFSGHNYWVAMELPLIQDGSVPTSEGADSPTRIAFINEDTGSFEKEFAYQLDPVARDGGFEVNGIVEILSYTENRFLVLERSFASGFDDGGNDVKIYEVAIDNATDISAIDNLHTATFTPVTKTLLFDFNDIRDQLTNSIVDNIEGITFGPILENGKRSLVLVADNNFSAFGSQLNQFILFEIL